MPTPDLEVSLFPEWLDRIQTRYVNPVVRPLAPYLPWFAVIEHEGRKTGRAYSTPVNAFRFDDTLCVALGHGRTDWVKNVLTAGKAEVRILGRRRRIVNPRVVDREEAGPGLPLAARLAGTRVKLFLADIATD